MVRRDECLVPSAVGELHGPGGARRAPVGLLLAPGLLFGARPFLPGTLSVLRGATRLPIEYPSSTCLPPQRVAYEYLEGCGRSPDGKIGHCHQGTRSARFSSPAREPHAVGEVGGVTRARDELQVLHGNSDRHPERVHVDNPRERSARVRSAIGDGEEVVVRCDEDRYQAEECVRPPALKATRCSGIPHLTTAPTPGPRRTVARPSPRDCGGE